MTETARFEIPEAELLFRATRASGPGGQHVNRSATRVELWWNVWMSTALSPAERPLVERRLANRIDDDGWIRLVASDTRSQLQNREAARRRLEDLVRRAMIPPKVRRKTRVPAGERTKRLEAKRRRSTVKRQRRPPAGDD